VATGLAIGSYTCTVTDANGCTHTQPVTIVSNNPVTLTLSTVPTGCTVNIGTATANAGNGVLPYTYNWSNGQTTSVATALGVGTYTVVVADANGCSRTQSIAVVSTNPVTMTINSTQTTCTANTGTATATPANGALPYTFLWNNGQTTQTAIGLDTGTYICTATDANGCTQTLNVVVTSHNPLTLTVDSTQTGCVPLTGTAIAHPANGTAPYSYVWSNGQTSQTDAGLGVGGYIVSVIDADGCVQHGSTTVTAFPLPVVAVSPAAITITSGETAILNATGGTGYLWSPADYLSCATCASTAATPLPPTTYCITITDVHGCMDSTCIRVEVLCNAGLLDKLIPTAFSPNNDGMNDQLCIPENVCIISFELDIYDRWGEKVFISTDINYCWDGTYKGVALGTAAFVYTFDARLGNGTDFKQKGTISLIK
jgi:gliding motility-associated-like protein